MMTNLNFKYFKTNDAESKTGYLLRKTPLSN